MTASTYSITGRSPSATACIRLALCAVLFAISVTSKGKAGADELPDTQRSTDPRPNIVLIVADDMGYADLKCFGGQRIQTPVMDRLAREGRKFTDFYVTQAVCSASRASLMTGCYANRISLAGALNHTSQEGIHPNEELLPELLKEQGYSTAILGKWHLGTRPDFHPQKHGFDQFWGIPYSNDNSRFHPVLKDLPPLPLYDGEQVAELDPDQAQFTPRITERAIQFIMENRRQPFFLYVPHIMPHVPLFGTRFRGQSLRGLYGDVIMELDWSLGEILKALKSAGVSNNTLVIFMSDNGPFLSYGDHAGSAGDLREGKLTTFEGGIRVPCIMRWPGHIPSGTVCSEPACSIDLLPTLVHLAEGRLPERKIDGRDIRDLMTDQPGAQSPHEALYFYAGGELQAIRSGKWKLHFEHDYLTVEGVPGRDGKPANSENLRPDSIEQSGIRGIASRHGYGVRHMPQSLYDLSADRSESVNVADQHPDVVARLTALAETIRSELGDDLVGRSGSEVRPAGRAD
ncbi:MAG: sulfatase [Planctomyces sp.]|nr:sulfatase [Planctomyces sp.]